MSFYQDLSPIYDDMINFSDRLESEKKVFENFLNNYPASDVLDAGCGSGFHTILLSQLKLKMTGMDNSTAMLDLAEKNAMDHQESPTFIKNDFLTLNPTLKNRFDAIFCLGNSFVHLLSEKDQIMALSNFDDYLRSPGYLCLQIVNYDKILKDRQQILAVRNVDNKMITRMYAFNKSTVTFTVKVESSEGCREISTELYPLQSEEILSLVERAGFNNAGLYGDLKLNPYQRYTSANICIICSHTD